MNNNLTLFDKILYGELMPWLDENKPDEKFAGLIGELKTREPVFPVHYQIDFHRPFNHKTRYYNKLILNEIIAYCDKIHQLLTEDDNLKLQKYWKNDTLDKKLPARLKDIGKLITDRQYALEYINPQKTAFNVDADHKTETFIVQLLKIALIRVCLEIQAFFPFLSEDDVLIEEDFYTQFLFEPVPENRFIKGVQPTLEISATVSPKPQLPSQTLNNCKSFRYKQYDTAPQKLTDCCDSLRKGNFLHQDTKANDFKKLFSGNEVEKPVIWTGNRSEFAYFIKLIHNTHKLVENLKQDQWKIAIQCFIKVDGSSFEIKDRKLQRPISTGDKLDSAVDLLI